MAPINIHHWHELSEQEKVPIKETSDFPDADYPIISVIDGLSREEQELVYNCVGADPCKCHDYNSLQRRWLGKEKEYLGLRLQQHPDEILDSELVKDMEEMRTCFRYKLYYVGKKYVEGKTDCIRINLLHASPKTLELIVDFFEDIDNACAVQKAVNSCLEEAAPVYQIPMGSMEMQLAYA